MGVKMMRKNKKDERAARLFYLQDIL